MKKFKSILKTTVQLAIISLLIYAAYLAACDMIIDKYDAIILTVLLIGVTTLLEDK